MKKQFTLALLAICICVGFQANAQSQAEIDEVNELISIYQQKGNSQMVQQLQDKLDQAAETEQQTSNNVPDAPATFVEFDAQPTLSTDYQFNVTDAQADNMNLTQMIDLFDPAHRQALQQAATNPDNTDMLSNRIRVFIKNHN